MQCYEMYICFMLTDMFFLTEALQRLDKAEKICALHFTVIYWDICCLMFSRNGGMESKGEVFDVFVMM